MRLRPHHLISFIMQFLRPSGREKPLTFLHRNTRGRSSFGGPSPLRPPQAFALPRRPAYDGEMEDPEVMVVGPGWLSLGHDMT